MSATKILWGQILAVLSIVLVCDLGRDRMGRLAARIPARTRTTMVSDSRLSLLPAARLFLVVVWL